MPVAPGCSSWASVQLKSAVDKSLLILTAPGAQELTTMVLEQDPANDKKELAPHLTKV